MSRSIQERGEGEGFLNRKETAKLVVNRGVKCTDKSLAAHASRGTGPEYHIINKKAYYRPSQILRWLERIAGPEFRSTGDRAAEGH